MSAGGFLGSVPAGVVGYGGNFAVPQEAPRDPLPRNDVIVGEIIGWRIWRIVGGYLQSFAMTTVWAPGETMIGEPGDYGHEGIWAFKEKSRALGKMMNEFAVEPSAYGSVSMWGEVVEHQDGYRAQFAKLLTIDGCINVSVTERRVLKWRTVAEERAALADIRERYGLVEAR